MDRDYKQQSDIQNIEKRGVIVLTAHEAESYLCHPEILIAIAKTVGTAASVPTTEELLKAICDFVEGMRLKIVARRIAARLNVRISVSAPSKALTRMTTDDQLKTLLMADVRQQQEHVSKKLNEKFVSGLVDSELAALKTALEEVDVVALLKLAPGKELLSLLASRVGCVDSNAVARAARHHLDLDEYASLVALKDGILANIPVGVPRQK